MVTRGMNRYLAFQEILWASLLVWSRFSLIAGLSLLGVMLFGGALAGRPSAGGAGRRGDCSMGQARRYPGAAR